MTKSLILLSVVMSITIVPANAQKWKEKLKEAAGVDNSQSNAQDEKRYTPEADLAKIGGPFEDKGMTSDLHKKYVGQIVFSKDKIPMENPQESSLNQNFNISDYVYGRVFMPRSIENLPIYQTQFTSKGDTASPKHNEYGQFYYKLYVDGKHYEYWYIEEVSLSKWNLVNTTTYQVWINPKPEDKKASDTWKKIMNDLSPGEHKIRVEMWGGTAYNYSSVEPWATGEFTIVKNDGEAFSATYGETFDDYEAGFTDEKLEADMLKELKAFAKRKGYKEEFLDVKIASREWNVVRDKISGAVLSRWCAVYCLAKWPDGHCSVQKFDFSQNHDGSKFSSVVYCNGAINTPQNVDCK